MSSGDAYRGEDSRLYGAGSNHPPGEHLQAALREASSIRPLARDGSPSPSGAIGLLSVGFSNAFEEFKDFAAPAEHDPEKAPAVRFANGAQDHMGTPAWATGSSEHGDPWKVLMERIAEADVTAPQVQVTWIKTSPPSPASLGEFPKHAELTKRDLHALVTRLGSLFPNLRIAYLSSRIYAGYSLTPLSPEPYAYEQAFALRWLIQDQIRGDPAVNWDPLNGPRRAPLLLWGPYLWADGVGGRKLDDLAWTREDFTADGTHPSPAGSRKVARLLQKFFKTDPTATPWFLRPEPENVHREPGRVIPGITLHILKPSRANTSAETHIIGQALHRPGNVIGVLGIHPDRTGAGDFRHGRMMRGDHGSADALCLKNRNSEPFVAGRKNQRVGGG